MIQEPNIIKLNIIVRKMMRSYIWLIAGVYTFFMTIEKEVSACKDCKDIDPASGETIEYTLANSELVGGKYPSQIKQKFTSCLIKNYKKVKDEEKYVYHKCTKHGGHCEKNMDCCQSYVRFKAATNLPVIMFSKCYQNKCVACLKNLWPCGGGSTIPCCGALVKGTDIACRKKDELSTTPFLPFVWGICGPSVCNREALKKLHLYNTPCYNYGDNYPQYDGVNFCKCGDNEGYQCNSKNNKCEKCKIFGFDTDSECTSDFECCKHHKCKWNGSSREGMNITECTQDDCVLEGQKDVCCDNKEVKCTKDKYLCCDGLRCLQVPKEGNFEGYSICTRVECSLEGSPCEVDYHCCQQKKLKCMRVKGIKGKICVNPKDPNHAIGFRPDEL